MTLRTGHGNGKGVPRIEVLPLDEQPAIIPDDTVPLRRDDKGRIADSETARAMGAKGGLARTHRARLASALGLVELADDCEFKPYRALGDEFVKHHLANLAAQCGGELGPAPSSIVVSAGLQKAASIFLGDKAAQSGDPKLFHQMSVLANDSRQNLLAAYELGIREAQARKAQRAPLNPLDAWMVSEKPEEKPK